MSMSLTLCRTPVRCREQIGHLAAVHGILDRVDLLTLHNRTFRLRFATAFKAINNHDDRSYLMRRTAITGAAALAAALALVLTGCGSDTKTEPSTSKSESTTTTTTSTKAAATTTAKVAPRDEDAAGPNPTIASYIAENNIQETPVKMGDPGAPKIDLPVPDGWAPGGENTPDWAYSAIVYNGPDAGDYTPSIVALMSKL